MLPLIAVIALAAGGLTAIILTILSWNRIVDWFKGRKELKESDKDNTAIILNQLLANGNFSTIEGIFNTRTNEFLDGVKYESKEIDEKLTEALQGKELLIVN